MLGGKDGAVHCLEEDVHGMGGEEAIKNNWNIKQQSPVWGRAGEGRAPYA